MPISTSFWDDPHAGEPPQSSPSDQWLRRAELFISSPSSTIELSDFRFTFAIKQAEAATPNMAMIRIYNLADATVLGIIKEYTQVIVQAGYWPPGRFGVVFKGGITRFDSGRDNNMIDSFLDIWAADADTALNYATTVASIPAGWTWHDVGNQCVADLESFGVDPGKFILPGFNAGVPLPHARGKVMFGPVAGQLRTMGRSTGGVWSIQNNVFHFVPQSGYLPGQAAVLNVDTGLVGVPVATPSGVYARCLLNPSLQVGGHFQIDNNLVNQTSAPAVPGQPGVRGLTPTGVSQTVFGERITFASVTNDGFYRIWVVEHEGDTRGNPWYTNLVGISIDPSAPDQPNQGVQGMPQPPLEGATPSEPEAPGP